MGSHINLFCPHSGETALETVQICLNHVTTSCLEELSVLQKFGTYSTHEGKWGLWREDDSIAGEGPCGFSIQVDREVACFTCIERFGVIVHADSKVRSSLHRIFESVAIAFGDGLVLAVAPGGYGDTDAARDLALSGADFSEICQALQSQMGVPARSWLELEVGETSWCLQNSNVDSGPFPR